MRGNEKSLQELNLEDDFLFAKVMSDEEVCSAVIESILGTKIRAVKLLNEQKTIALDLDAKGTLDDVGQELKAFLKYVEHSTAETVDQSNSALLKRVHKRVEFIKTDKRLEVEYMTLLERDRKNREEGKAEGLLEGKVGGIMELLSDLGTPSDLLKEKIMSMDDAEVLNHWLKLAARSKTLDEFEKKMEPETKF